MLVSLSCSFFCEKNLENFPKFFSFFFPKNFKKKIQKKKEKKRSKKTRQTTTLLLWISFVSIIRESTKKEARFFLPFVCVCRDDDADPKDDDLYTTRRRRSRAFEEREREKENFFLEFFKNNFVVDILIGKSKRCACVYSI